MSDINVTIIDREKQAHDIQAPTDMGMNLMELCKAYEFPVEGTCGGMALCSSCHIYIKSKHSLPERSDAEEDALDEAIEVDEKCSRLGCQIHISPDLEGLVIEIAPDS